MGKFDRLWLATQAEIPGARIVNKQNSAFMMTIFTVLSFVTRRKRSSWDQFSTTIWRTIYVPPGFFHWSDEAKYRHLRHELVHLRQFRRWPFGFLESVWPVNALIMSFCYLFVFPFLWTLRAKFEREGYTQTMLSWYENHGFNVYKRLYYSDLMGKVFGGSAYAWMWSDTKAKIWAYDTMDAIELGKITNDLDNVNNWP